MIPGQSLAGIVSQLAIPLEKLLVDEKPDLVLSQGDTTTVMLTSMVCFFHKVPFAHLEAGLRSGDILNPFPEEYNRKVATLSAALHLAPTLKSKNALLNEGIPESKIYITGNTVIDSLYYVREHIPICQYPINPKSKLLLLTAHRRENFGQPLTGIFEMLRLLVDSRPDIELLYPVHPNPMVAETAKAILSNHERIHLSVPMDYLHFLAALNKAYFVITDSGGVQEEAPAIGKPVLVLRDVTERHESVEAGVAKLVGTSPEVVKKIILRLLDNKIEYAHMSKGFSPYGDGMASLRVVDVISVFLGINKKRELSDFNFKLI